MKKRLLLIFIIPLFLLSFFFSPTRIFASSYGDGSYGECTYGGSEDCNGNNNSSNQISSVVSNVTNTITTWFCTTQAPVSAPNLYEIQTTGNTATLFFSPAGGPYDSFFVSYGAGNNSEGNGIEFDQGLSNGAITYTVNQLSPSTTYTFKVRAGNGCQPGDWSSNMTVKTQQKGAKKIAQFTPTNQATYTMAQKQPAGNWLTNWWQPQPTATPAVVAKTPQQPEVMGAKAPAPKEEQKKQPTTSQPWIGDTIINFFKGIFNF